LADRRSRPRGAVPALGLALALAVLGCQPAAPPAVQPPAGTAPSATAVAAPGATAAVRPLPLRMAYAARNGSQALAQLLLDSGLLADNGLDATLIYTDGPPRTVAALVTGELDVAFLGGEPAFRAAVEGADVVAIAGIVNRREHILFSAPEVRTVADLRGKRVAINGIQSADHQSVLDALRHYGVDANDVGFLVVGGGQQNRLTAIQTGAVDAAGLQPPITARARALGLNQLLAVGEVVDRAIPNTAVVSSRAAIAERPEVLRRFARALVQGIHLYSAEPEVTLRALAAFFDLDLAENRADLEETQKHYAALYPALPYPPLEGYRALLEEIAETNPRASGYRLADAVDESFIRALDPSGPAGEPAAR
jgi:ABC-type nitrate/sulfonate/bicarbonate transport system substrate-binding protein